MGQKYLLSFFNEKGYIEYKPFLYFEDMKEFIRKKEIEKFSTYIVNLQLAEAVYNV